MSKGVTGYWSPNTKVVRALELELTCNKQVKMIDTRVANGDRLQLGQYGHVCLETLTNYSLWETNIDVDIDNP